MSVGQTKDLSGCYENIKVSNHWPGNANCPIVQGLNMYVSNTAVAYISGTKLIANSTGDVYKRQDRTIPDKARKWWGRLHERGNKDHRKDFRGKYPLPQFHCRENAKIVL